MNILHTVTQDSFELDVTDGVIFDALVVPGVLQGGGLRQVTVRSITTKRFDVVVCLVP